MLFNYSLRLLFYTFLILFIYQRPLCAKDLFFSPSIKVGETYTDNLNLTADNKKSAFVTEISPGISASKNTEWVKLNFDYRLQNLFNASSGENKLFHMLNFNSRFQVVKNSLFFEARANNSQQNVNNNVLTNNNINALSNRTDVTSYGFSPHWMPHFNGYANGNFRFDYDELSTGSNNISNTTRTGEHINITSDKRFSSNLLWRITYDNQEQSNSNSNNTIQFQNAEAEARFNFTKQLNLFALVGNSDNTYQTINNSYKNGSYYTVGAQWRPTQKFSVEAGYGNNIHITLNLTPSKNMTWKTTFRHRKVGTNLGNTWQSNFNYKTQRANFNASYFEDTASAQSALLGLGQTYGAQNIFQQARFDQSASQINYNLPTLTNDVYIRKRANAGLSYQTGKSVFGVALYHERRLFQLSDIKEEVSGLFASWNWQFARSMSLYISPLWQHTSRFNSKDTRNDIAIGVSKTIPIKLDREGGMNAFLEYRHSKQTSDLIENNFNENRLTANLIIAF